MAECVWAKTHGAQPICSARSGKLNACIGCSVLPYIGMLESPKDMREPSIIECTLISALKWKSLINMSTLWSFTIFHQATSTYNSLLASLIQSKQVCLQKASVKEKLNAFNLLFNLYLTWKNICYSLFMKAFWTSNRLKRLKKKKKHTLRISSEFMILQLS